MNPISLTLANGWLKSYEFDYRLEQASLNTEIDKALDDYYSKMVALAETVPMWKLLFTSSKNGRYLPLRLIEYKGHKLLENLDVDG